MTQPNFDKTARHRITVTRADIEDGETRECWYCPVALAASRAFGLPCAVGTELVTVYDEFEGKSLASFRFSQAVWNRINEFDEGRGMTPFTFTVKL